MGGQDILQWFLFFTILLLCMGDNSLSSLVRLTQDANTKLPLALSADTNQSESRHSKFIWFNKNKDSNDIVSSDDLLKLQIYALERKLENLEEELEKNCDEKVCTNLQYHAYDLDDELSSNSENVHQLFDMVNTIMQKLDPCNRAFPKYDMIHRKGRSSDIEARDSGVIEQHSLTEEEEVLSIKDVDDDIANSRMSRDESSVPVRGRSISYFDTEKRGDLDTVGTIIRKSTRQGRGKKKGKQETNVDINLEVKNKNKNNNDNNNKNDNKNSNKNKVKNKNEIKIMNKSKEKSNDVMKSTQKYKLKSKGSHKHSHEKSKESHEHYKPLPIYYYSQPLPQPPPHQHQHQHHDMHCISSLFKGCCGG